VVVGVREGLAALTPAEERVVRAYRRYAENRWAFLTECVFTEDQAAQGKAVRQYPALEYLHCLNDVVGRYPILVIVKSRRMLATWTMTAIALHAAMFKPHRAVFMQSQKQDDSENLVDRCKFIYDHIPPDKLPLLPLAEKTYCKLEMPRQRSQVVGVAQGANQLVQPGASAIFMDEFWRWPLGRESFTAARPIISGSDGGGFMVAFSSPDLKNAWGQELLEGVEFQPVTEGIQIGLVSEGFAVMLLHYEADPGKRSEEWRAREREGLGEEDWEAQYELSFVAASSGASPFAGQFNSAFHVASSELPVDPKLPLYLGWDASGLQPGAVACQVKPNGQVQALREWQVQDEGVAQFISAVVAECRILFPDQVYRDYCDPQAFHRDALYGHCAADIFQKVSGRRYTAGMKELEPRLEAVRGLLERNIAGQPALLVSPVCRYLVRAFQGAYRRKMKAGRPGSIDKNIFCNTMEALQYFLSAMFPAATKFALPTSTTKAERPKAREAHYSFGWPGERRAGQSQSPKYGLQIP
jgi:hypothetical protein